VSTGDREHRRGAAGMANTQGLTPLTRSSCCVTAVPSGSLRSDGGALAFAAASTLPPVVAYNPRRPVSIAISERRIGDITILEVQGQVVFQDGAAMLWARLDALLNKGRVKVLLDLRAVTYLDSFGVGVIAAKYASARRKGGDVKLLSPSARSDHVLRTAGLMNIFDAFDTEDEALRSFELEAGK
jgi:anti-anti-sigma factor